MDSLIESQKKMMEKLEDQKSVIQKGKDVASREQQDKFAKEIKELEARLNESFIIHPQ